MNNAATTLPLPAVYYHARETSYWRMDEDNRWIKVNDASAKCFIVEQGYSKNPAEPGANSEVDRCLMTIQTRQNVAYVGPLAGHPSGVHRMGEACLSGCLTKPEILALQEKGLRMRRMFAKDGGILAEDYDHFTQPGGSTPPNKAGRRSGKPHGRPVPKPN